MSNSYALQPSVRQVLSADTLAEAQVVAGQDHLEKQIMQVVSSLSTQPRPGSLLVLDADHLATLDKNAIKELAGLVLIRTQVDVALKGTGTGGDIKANTTSLSDQALKQLVKRCNEAQTPLILYPGYGEVGQIVEDFRYSFLQELKNLSARLYSTMLNIAIEEGLDGLIETVSSWLNRPLAVESADFKLLAARNMGSTPANQQKALQDEAAELLKAQQKSHLAHDLHTGIGSGVGSALEVSDDALNHIKLGRRLVFPVVLSEIVMGYVSVMVRQQDEPATLAEYMHALTLACKVGFSHRLKDTPVLTITMKSLLKDLLAGSPLSSSDQERVERHFGFDLCDGFLVLALEMKVVKKNGKATAGETTSNASNISLPDDRYVSVDVDGIRAFVLPQSERDKTTWIEAAEGLVAVLKDKNPHLHVKLGASREVATMLELSDAFREARQTLLIGSMMANDQNDEFMLCYRDLGVKRLLYLVLDHPELDRFLQETLEPLEAYDEEWESELVDTLRGYLEQGANLNSTARALFIHRHTLRYRLEQIADILKVDIDSQIVLLNLQIAFLIRDMRGDSRKRNA